MSEIVLPDGFCPNAFTLWQITNQRVFASPYGGSEQALDMGNDRWGIYLTLPNRKFPDAARVEAFIAALRGMTNTVRLYHWARKVPRGTMRGTPTAQAANAGTQALILNTVAGATLEAGDMIGLAGLLLQVASPTVADGAGAMPVTVVNRLRVPVPPGSAVTWDRPTALFRQSSQSARVQYIPGYAPEVPFDFVEVVS